MKTDVIRVSTLTLAISATSLHASTETFTVNGLSPAGDLANPGNGVATGAIAGSFVAQSLTWSGQIASAPNPFFFEEDVFASIEGPNGIGYTGPIAGEQGIFLGATPFSGWTSGFTPATASGSVRIDAFTPNTFPSSTDWTLNDTDFAFNDSLFPAAADVNIGTTLTAPLTEGQIQWYAIDHAGGGIQFSTADSILNELDGAISTDDTLIALYDANGVLVDFNDDRDADFTSLLTFANLGAGEYHLAVTGATLGTRVGSQFIATSHDGEGTIALAVTIPAPATSLLVAAGIATAARRRR